MKKYICLLLCFIWCYSAQAQYIFQKSGGNQLFFVGITKAIDSGYLLSGGFGTTTLSILKIDELGDTVWTKSYDGPNGGNIETVKLYDSSYISFGELSSFSVCADMDDMYMMKIKLNGDTIWTKHYGTCHGDMPHNILKAPNNGYYIYGTEMINPPIAGGITIIRLSEMGDTLWTRFINMSPNPINLANLTQENFASAATPDGGILISGMVMDSTITPRHSWIMKIDSNGTIQWHKFLDYPPSNIIKNIFTTASGYLLAGLCTLHNPANYVTSEFGTMMVKIDFNGNIIWGKVYENIISGADPERAFSGVLQSTMITNDGGVFVAGVRQLRPGYQGNYHSLVSFKTDSAGNVLWLKKHNIDAVDVMPMRVCQTRDNGFLITAYRNTDSTQTAYNNNILVKIDSLGNSCNDSTLTMQVVDFTNQIVTSDTIVPLVGFYPVVVGHSPFTIGTGVNYKDVCSGNVGVKEYQHPT